MEGAAVVAVSVAVEQEAVADLVENGTRVEAGLIDCQRELQRG